MAHDGEVTDLLLAWGEGDREALDRLFPIVYRELRGIAHRRLLGERPGHTLGTTGLVHEAYLRLVRIERVEWRNRSQFFAVSARAMRRVLVDYALMRKAEKRGGGQVPLPLEEVVVAVESHADDIVALDEALRRLEVIDERHSRVVECRLFAGMSVEETAAALDISPATVKRDWAMARAWLNRELAS
ncbi:MAG: sigma-70 family RNA polymerase sigma factor [Longimicrobiales bacterium]